MSTSVYLVTVESTVAAPASDLLFISRPRRNDTCPATEVAYLPSDFIVKTQWLIGMSLIGNTGGRWPRHNLTQLAEVGRCALFITNGGKLYTVSVSCGQDSLLGPS